MLAVRALQKTADCEHLQAANYNAPHYKTLTIKRTVVDAHLSFNLNCVTKWIMLYVAIMCI